VLPVASTQQGQISMSHSIHGFMKVSFTHRRYNDFTRDKQQDSGRNTDFKIQECFSGVCICDVKSGIITRQLVNTGKGGVCLFTIKERKALGRKL